MATTVQENLKAVLEERAGLWETAGKPLADIAAERDFTADEATKFEQAEEAHRAFDQRIKAMQLTIDQERALAEFSAVLGDNSAVRSAFESELRSVLVERTKNATELGFTAADFKRALTSAVTPAGAGGELIAQTFWAQLIQPLRNFSSVLDAGATSVVTASGEEITMPVVLDYGKAQKNIAPGTAIGGTDPKFKQEKWGTSKYGQIILAARELVEDTAIDIEAFLADLIGQNIGVELGADLAVGANGLFTKAGVGVTGAGVAPTFDELIDLQHSVLAGYRRIGSFILADTALAGVRKLKDTQGGYLWQPSVQLGTPDLLLGRPAYTEASAETPAAGKRSVVFGDVSRYWVRTVNSLRLERSDHAAFTTDQVAFKGVLRAGGILTDVNAVKAFVGKAA